jgi:hypothetical protein
MSMIISAAAAFSPQYTEARLDSVYVTQRDSLLVPAFTPIDSLTNDLRSYLPQHQIHVPFDSLGNINNFIWDLWMQHNIQNMYEANVNGTAAQFSAMPKLLIESRGAEFHFDEQMDAFIQFLQNSTDPSKYTVMDFRGNPNLTGTADHFLYDLLDDILIFHSNNFAASAAAK